MIGNKNFIKLLQHHVDMKADDIFNHSQFAA